MAQPHYLLFCDATAENKEIHSLGSDGADSLAADSMFGRWRFTLEQLDGNRRFEAADSEINTNQDRLALMSVVRGLEALEQPSNVTLVTTSNYVSRGLRFGLSSWRERDYTWERFGLQMPIRNADLWQRVDGALRFHGVTCRLIRAGASDNISLVPKRDPNIDDGSCVDMPAASEIEPEFISGRVAEESLPRVRLGATDYRSDGRHERLNNMHPPTLQDAWRQLIAAWIQWCRGRSRPRPTVYGAV